MFCLLLNRNSTQSNPRTHSETSCNVEEKLQDQAHFVDTFFAVVSRGRMDSSEYQHFPKPQWSGKTPFAGRGRIDSPERQCPQPQLMECFLLHRHLSTGCIACFVFPFRVLFIDRQSFLTPGPQASLAPMPCRVSLARWKGKARDPFKIGHGWWIFNPQSMR